MLTGFLLLLVLLPGAAYWLLAWYAVQRHLRNRSDAPCPYSPRVSILKPIRGADAESYDNFASFCRQDYPAYEILFGVRDADDPAVAVVERLRRDLPKVDIRLIVCQGLFVNPKVSTLHGLLAEASGEVLVISDGDVRVEADYLRRIVSPLADPTVGIVTCPYRGEVTGGNWVAKLAALHMNAAFVPSAILAGTLLGVRVGLGASMAMRRGDLERIGGFAAVGDYLAEDYQLASRMADLGMTIHLAQHVVTCPMGAMPFVEQWQRELRWARTIRASSGGYFGLPLTWLTVQAVVLAIILAPIGGLWAAGLVGLGLALALRWLVAWRIGRHLGVRSAWRTLPWLPVRDLMTSAVWFAGLFGTSITWREQRFRLRDDGRLQADQAAGEAARFDPIRSAVKWLDRYLRQRDGVYEYSQHPQCIFRVGIAHTADAVDLANGTHLDSGQAFGDLHLWNEHVPQIPSSGPGIAWAISLTHRLKRSLRDLAQQVTADARLVDVQAYRAVVTFAAPDRISAITRIMVMLGFELVERRRPMSMGERLHLLGEEILMVGLRWTFNPGARLEGTRQRLMFWISRRKLLEMHGAQPQRETLSSSRVATGGRR